MRMRQLLVTPMIFWRDRIVASRLVSMAVVSGLWGRLAFLVVCCFFAMGSESETMAAGNENEAERMAFDIPPQPLGNALFAYTRVTGAEIFADNALIAGRRSARVRGEYDRITALRKLLAGNGLEIRRAADNAFTVVDPTVPEPPLERLAGWSAENERFYAAVQTAVRRALCARADVGFGSYRVALALWIDAAGTVTEVRLLSPSVDEETGRALLAGIGHVSVGQSPSPHLPQPVTLVLLPRPAGATRDCTPETARGD